MTITARTERTENCMLNWGSGEELLLFDFARYEVRYWVFWSWESHYVTYIYIESSYTKIRVQLLQLMRRPCSPHNGSSNVIWLFTLSNFQQYPKRVCYNLLTIFGISISKRQEIALATIIRMRRRTRRAEARILCNSDDVDHSSNSHLRSCLSLICDLQLPFIGKSTEATCKIIEIL
jgi:hypothetical protein